MLDTLSRSGVEAGPGCETGRSGRAHHPHPERWLLGPHRCYIGKGLRGGMRPRSTAQPQPRPFGREADRAGKSALSPGLIGVLARMAEAALDAEDALAGGGNMPDRRDPEVATADRRQYVVKEPTP